jgi:nucleoside-diphosphate-sugar epimerase
MIKKAVKTRKNCSKSVLSTCSLSKRGKANTLPILASIQQNKEKCNDGSRRILWRFLLPAPKDEVLSKWAGKVEFRRGDIRDAKLIAGLTALSGTVDPIIHLASLFTSLIPEKAAKGEHYDIEVTPDTSYPVVYIKDAIDAILKLMSVPEAKGRIYNIA